MAMAIYSMSVANIQLNGEKLKASTQNWEQGKVVCALHVSYLKY